MIDCDRISRPSVAHPSANQNHIISTCQRKIPINRYFFFFFHNIISLSIHWKRNDSLSINQAFEILDHHCILYETHQLLHKPAFKLHPTIHWKIPSSKQYSDNMKFLGLLCIFVALGIRVEGRFLSTQIGNSLPALNYRTAPSNELHPAFMTRSRRTNLHKIQPAKIDIGDEIQETSLKRSTRRTIASDFRGGSAAAAKVARTMTARRMESLK